MGDFEEDDYGYGGYDDFRGDDEFGAEDDEFGDDDDEGVRSSSFESPDSEGGFDENRYDDSGGEGVDMQATYADTVRTQGGKTDVGEQFKNVHRRTSTAEVTALEKVQGVMSSTFSDLNQTHRQKVIDYATDLDRLPFMNVPVLVAALVWKVQKHKLDAQTLQTFHSKNVPSLALTDVVRYVRFVERL
jgi:hypothetical protein